MLPPGSFESRLSAARNGADWAWREIYRDLAPLILGFLRARGAHEPEDLVGETFTQVVRDLDRFEGGERAGDRRRPPSEGAVEPGLQLSTYEQESTRGRSTQ